ncbi:hypothetical protein CC80DRAFT_579243 [Byssothecium circinans]|uniref:Uncharacterized protein n=1 Tax=Byssothecium circinans TaxID=147558 RepID=A0A6A5TAG4_9PLEO|nr:hypothetical protein CC80DRAFT_579243 [Byssothecium circinans]
MSSSSITPAALSVLAPTSPSESTVLAPSTTSRDSDGDMAERADTPTTKDDRSNAKVSCCNAFSVVHNVDSSQISSSAAGPAIIDAPSNNKRKRDDAREDPVSDDDFLDPEIEEEMVELDGSDSDEPATKVAKTSANKDGKKPTIKKQTQKESVNDVWGGEELNKRINAEERRRANTSSGSSKLLKALRKSNTIPLPKHSSSNIIGSQKVSLGAEMPKISYPYNRRQLLQDVKHVDQYLTNITEIEIKVEGDNEEVEVLALPRSTKVIRVTELPAGKGGEKAHLDDIRKKPDWFPHITIKEEKDEQGRTIVLRKKVEPEKLVELRTEKMERKRKNKGGKGRGKKRQSVFEKAEARKDAKGGATVKDKARRDAEAAETERNLVAVRKATNAAKEALWNKRVNKAAQKDVDDDPAHVDDNLGL